MSKLSLLTLLILISAGCNQSNLSETEVIHEAKNTEERKTIKPDTSKEEWIKEMKASGLYKHAWGLN